MSFATGCVVLSSFLFVDNQSLPLEAQRLTLRKAFQVSTHQGWYSDIDAARAESVKSRLPLVLHFEAEWCGACKRMSAAALDTPEVREKLGRGVIGVKVDADRYPQLITQFHVAVLPSDVFIGVDGRILATESGPRGKADYLASLKQASEAVGEDFEWQNVKLGQEALKESPTSRACVVARRGGVIVGLGGFSPVTMKVGKKWTRGNRNYTSIYQGVMYYMQNAEELKTFEESPAEYAPKLHGCDPVVFSNRGAPLPGKMQLGIVYRDDLYFFASEASRKLFRLNPKQYIKNTNQLVRGEDLTLPTYR